jgi:hypothetical protein
MTTELFRDKKRKNSPNLAHVVREVTTTGNRSLPSLRRLIRCSLPILTTDPGREEKHCFGTVPFLLSSPPIDILILSVIAY